MPKRADKGNLIVKIYVDKLNFINYEASVGNSPKNEFVKEMESKQAHIVTIPPESQFIVSGLYPKGGGSYSGASHGWFAILPPLREGIHNLNYQVEVVATGDLVIKANEWNFKSDVNYEFTVEKSR